MWLLGISITMESWMFSYRVIFKKPILPTSISIWEIISNSVSIFLYFNIPPFSIPFHLYPPYLSICLIVYIIYHISYIYIYIFIYIESPPIELPNADGSHQVLVLEADSDLRLDLFGMAEGRRQFWINNGDATSFTL